jgi:hypothetical protein
MTGPDIFSFLCLILNLFLGLNKLGGLGTGQKLQFLSPTKPRDWTREFGMKRVKQYDKPAENWRPY